jgi:hypothetical protein
MEYQNNTRINSFKCLPIKIARRHNMIADSLAVEDGNLEPLEE